jgi:hypothetical protein
VADSVLARLFSRTGDRQPRSRYRRGRRPLVCSAETLLGATGREESRPNRQECLRHVVHYSAARSAKTCIIRPCASTAEGSRCIARS